MVSADSSKYVVGAVFCSTMMRVCGMWQPIEYASQKLTEARTLSAMVETQALAVTWDCKQYCYSLVFGHFEIETGHEPLIVILGGEGFFEVETVGTALQDENDEAFLHCVLHPWNANVFGRLNQQAKR